MNEWKKKNYSSQRVRRKEAKWTYQSKQQGEQWKPLQNWGGKRWPPSCSFHRLWRACTWYSQQQMQSGKPPLTPLVLVLAMNCKLSSSYLWYIFVMLLGFESTQENREKMKRRKLKCRTTLKCVYICRGYFGIPTVLDHHVAI